MFSVLDDSDHRYLPRQGVSDFASLIVLVSKALPMLRMTAMRRIIFELNQAFSAALAVVQSALSEQSSTCLYKTGILNCHNACTSR